MTDIVKRLRTIEMREAIRKDLCEAAAEIERLRETGQQMLFAFSEGVAWSHDQRKAYEDFASALSAQPSEQPVSDDDDLPEVLANCETCRAIIRDGDVFVMDDYCVCLCRKCMAADQEGGE